MAKRKPARKPRRPASARAKSSRKSTRRTASATRRTSRKAPARKARTARAASAARKTKTKKTARKKTTRKTAARKPAARTSKAATARRTAAAPTRAAGTKRAAKTRTKKAPRAGAPAARKVPRLERARWTVLDDDTLAGPPDVEGADRPNPPAHEPFDRFAEHGGTGPAIAGGDLDADWESASNVGDEAPGGDNPTPDQDRVDEIGHAIGVEFEDEEVLDVENKITDRDRHRWERDPGSSDDFDER